LRLPGPGEAVGVSSFARIVQPGARQWSRPV